MHLFFKDFQIQHFKDVYFYKGIYYTSDKILEKISLHPQVYVPCGPDELKPLSDLINLVGSENLEKAKIEHRPVVHCHNFHSNPGHNLWDQMYSTWYSLFYFLPDVAKKDDFISVVSPGAWNHHHGWPMDLLKRFCGSEVKSRWHLVEDNIAPHTAQSEIILKIPNFIAGCAVGIGCIEENFCSRKQLKSHSEDPVDVFVNRLYNRYNITRNKNVGKNNNIYYILNKRPYQGVENLFTALNKKYSNKFNFEIVDLSKYDFESQLRMANSTKIIICGVGTARANTPFLPHGGLEIQTGNFGGGNIMDEHIGTLSSFVKVLHVEDLTSPYSDQEIMSRNAIKKLESSIEQCLTYTVEYPIRNLESNLPAIVRKYINHPLLKKFYKDFVMRRETNSYTLIRNIINNEKL